MLFRLLHEPKSHEANSDAHFVLEKLSRSVVFGTALARVAARASESLFEMQTRRKRSIFIPLSRPFEGAPAIWRA